MESRRSTESIYDEQAEIWARRTRSLLSDYTARPRVLEVLAPLQDAHLLDLGCGEGYVARLAAEAGAASVFGIDVSSEMIARANSASAESAECPLEFVTGDASGPLKLPREKYERISAVFLFNYLTRGEMARTMASAREHIAPGGRFVFSVPHPCFPYMKKPGEPFFFETGGKDYYAAVDHTLEGKIWTVEGEAADVRCVHKTFADYFEAIRTAGWTALPRVEELGVTEEHIDLAPKFFEPLAGLPLHLLFVLEEPA